MNPGEDDPDEVTLWAGRLRAWPAAPGATPAEEDLPDEDTRLSIRDLPDDDTRRSARDLPDEDTRLSVRDVPDEDTRLSVRDVPDDETRLSVRDLPDDETRRSVRESSGSETPEPAGRVSRGGTVRQDPAVGGSDRVDEASGLVAERAGVPAVDAPDEDTAPGARRVPGVDYAPAPSSARSVAGAEVPDEATVARRRPVDLPDDATVAQPPTADDVDDVTIARRPGADGPDEATVSRGGVSIARPDDRTASARSRNSARRTTEDAAVAGEGRRAARVPDAAEREIYRPRADGAVRVERREPQPRPTSGDAAAVHPRTARRGAGRAVVVIAIAALLLVGAGVALVLLVV